MSRHLKTFLNFKIFSSDSEEESENQDAEVDSDE